MKNAKLLLERLTEIVPPGKNMRHNLTINEDADLVLHFMLDNEFIPIIIEESDLEKPVHQLVGEIELVLIKRITS